MAQKRQLPSFLFNENPKEEIRFSVGNQCWNQNASASAGNPRNCKDQTMGRPAQSLTQTSLGLVATTLPAPGTHNTGMWWQMEKYTFFVLL